MSPARTTAEIVERAGASDSFLGFSLEVLFAYVPFADAQAAGLLKADADPTKWGATKTPDRDTVLADMREYMAFAWGKVLDHRGISAGRSVEKMREWLWLLGDDEGVAFASDDANYPQYGAPVLAWICRKYDLPIPGDESALRMARGERCDAGYDCGCGG